jgi:hypothetical protein
LKVYLLIHESYSYWDEDTTFKVYTFKDRASAIIYMEILSEKLIDEALEINKDIVVNNREDDDYNYIEQDENSLYIAIDEWGHEYVYIEEQDVMAMFEC